MAGVDDFDVEDLLEEAYNKKPRSEENGSENESRREDKKRHHKHRRRSRSRSRSKSPRRRHRRRSGSRERRRSRDRQQSGSKEHRRHRSRSRSPRRKSRSPRRSSPRRDREKVERRRSPTPPRRASVGVGGGGPAAPPMYKRVGGRSPEPELPSEDRDRRTVMCMQLAAKVGPKHLEEFFQKVGQVREVKMIADKNSRRSKGIAYVEFHDESSVMEAMKLSGQRVYGVPIIVQPTMAEKNRLAAQAQNLMKQEGPRKVYVGSLHYDIKEEMLKRIFEPFGTVETLMIQRDDHGQSKGFGFIEFKDSDAAERAVQSLNDFEILGKSIKVTLVTENPMGGMAAFAMAGATTTAAMETLDSDEYLGGVGLTLQTRANLMAKLAENHNVGISAPKIVGLPVSSTCFMLSNMFDPSAESEPGWDADIRDDVLEECSVHGPVLHIHVDTYSQGNVYVKCVTPQIASAAFNALNGRMFSGKRIVAQFIPEDTYHLKFPAALAASQPLKPLSVPA